MEDILASIRRIIADDQSQGNRTPPAQRRSAPPVQAKSERPPEHAEVFDLGRMSAPAADKVQPASAEQPAAPMRPIQPEPPMQAEEAPRADDPRVARPAPPAAAAPPPHVNGYTSPTLVRGLEQAQAPERYPGPAEADLPSLQADKLSGDEGLMTPALGTSVMSAFETLAATVVLQNTDLLSRVMRELMRPMIKTWLDENLPGMVERLVRSEIERMARGSR